MGFPFLTIIIIFIIVLAVLRKRSDNKAAEKEENFWNRELEANSSVRTDIDMDALPYVKVQMDVFPKDMAETPGGSEIYNGILSLSEQRIMNLGGKTNTDLKIEYGRNHLDEMQKIGENFENLIILIVSAAEYLISQSRYSEAEKVLEYGMSLHSDISKNYMLLGDCYKALNETRKIRSLKESVASMHLMMEKAIITHLDELLEGEEEPALESFSTEGD